MKPGDLTDGAWDCSHSYEPGEHHDAWIALGRPTDPEAAINVVKRAWHEDSESWIEANRDSIAADSRGMIDPRDAYHAWRDAWQTQAISYTRSYMRGWILDHRASLGFCDVCGRRAEGNTCCP